PTVEDVLPRPADQDVVPVAAEEGVAAGTADQNIIAVPAVRVQRDRGGGQPRRLHHVVAGPGVDDQKVIGRLAARDVYLGSQTNDGHTARVAGDGNDVVTVGAVDDDGVGLVVAGAAAGSGGQVEVDLGHVGTGQVVHGDGVGAAQGLEVDLLDAV